MSNLGSQQINSSYSGLLQIPGGVTSSLQTVQDGNGNSTGLSLSTTGSSIITSSTFVATKNGTPFTNAVTRLITDGFGDIINVKDFGATGDGTTDDTAAFQKAYNAVNANGSIYIPQGVYNVGSITPSGTKQIFWFGPGAQSSDISQLFLTLPGTVQSTPNPGYMQLRQQLGKATDFAVLNSERAATYTGGTNFVVNANGRFKTYVLAGAKSFEWSVLGIMDNYSVTADGSQNVAGYFQAVKNATGATWGQVSELQCKLADPVDSSITHEFDMTCHGTDTTNHRIGIHLQCGTTTPGSYSEAGTGVLVATGPTSKFKKGLVLDGSFDYYLYSNNFNTGLGGNLYIDSAGYTSLGAKGIAGLTSAFLTLGKSSVDSLDLMRSYTDSTLVFKIIQNGNLQNINNSYGAISDINVKENVVDASKKLEDINKVRVVNFNLKDDVLKTKQIGVIAQELEQIFPGLIEEDSEGMKGVKYSVFVPMLIKAVQELSDKIDILEKKLMPSN